MLALIYNTGRYNNIHTVNVTVTKLQESMIVFVILCIQSLLEICSWSVFCTWYCSTSIAIWTTGFGGNSLHWVFTQLMEKPNLVHEVSQF